MGEAADDYAADVSEILHYWFGEAERPQTIIEQKKPLWWGGGEAVDAEIRSRFGDRVKAAVAGELHGWPTDARGTLAQIILLDQFTRNVYRGTAEAFSGDPRARALAEALLEGRADRALRPIERVFIYMPLEHTEDLGAQDRCVALFEELLAEVTEDRGIFENYLGYAHRHRDIVVKFGRFPHRNPILGREPTAEETAWLAAGGDTFGQK